MGKSNLSVPVSYLRYIFQMSILPYLSDTGAMYLEYLTEDTFKSIFPNPVCNAGMAIISSNQIYFRAYH